MEFQHIASPSQHLFVQSQKEKQDMFKVSKNTTETPMFLLLTC